MRQITFKRGDTLVEVLFAITIFSLVVVGGISIMNQGAAASQRALEISLVRNEIDAQADTLRYLNSAYISSYRGDSIDYGSGAAGQWQDMQTDIISTNNSSVSDFGGSSCSNPPNGSFVVNTKNASLVRYADANFAPAESFSQVKYDISNNFASAEGIWIEAIRSANGSGDQSELGFIDFYIRACWDSPGQNVPVTIGTIVRLYEPRS